MYKKITKALILCAIIPITACDDVTSVKDTSEAALDGTVEYHVSMTGSDENPGTASKPLGSISAAASIAEPGDTITVHKGVYRERVNPPRGGVSAHKRITYQAAADETVEIKGSEQVTGWQRVENDSWKLTLDNSFFGDFNPYNDVLAGHWFYPSGQPPDKSKDIEPRKHHTGAVYLNGAWLNEAASLKEALQPTGDQAVWFATVTDTKTTIWAQFPQVDPNQELTEINVRQTVFFPDQSGLNYITVRGFTMSHAATPWAPPTQKQMGLIGPHWSRGWIIEDNDIGHAATACVQLGIKEMGDFEGNVHGMNAILRQASESGEWTGEKVGDHIIRRNRIHDCGATGINGQMGASFSLIEENHIYDIHRDRRWSGLEQGGIKLHAAIDTVIRNNVIYRAGYGRARALWIDWLAQGAVIEGNICFDNNLTDLFLEVSHGPTLVANNVFLSKTSIVSTSRGAAYVNNYIAGDVLMASTPRKTPFVEPHTTRLMDLVINTPLDNRFMNNIFAGDGPAVGPGFRVTAEEVDLLPHDMRNNLYLGAAQPPVQEKNPVVLETAGKPFELTLAGDEYSLEWNVDMSWLTTRTRAVITAKDLGLTYVGKHPFENADGSPVVVDRDMAGRERNASNTMPGPIESPGKGSIKLGSELLDASEKVWESESLSDQQRVEALLKAMTVEEKMTQLMANSPAIPRLGILPYNWWSEALHGVARNGRATVFPQSIGLAATFDDDLIFQMASAISDEARAKFNIAQSMQNYAKYAGLTFWSPNVNLFRDPRWGRGMETYGEDPYLQARMGTAFVKGLQGDNPDHMKVAACAKHYVVHSGPEALRHEFDAVAPKRDFYESYLPAFEALVKEGGVECVMCAYNRTYGEPSCGSELLLKDILRDQWGFKGHVVSDCGAVKDFHRTHKVAPNEAEAAAWALKAGTDVNCGQYYQFLPDALEQGLITKSDVDTALSRLLHTKMKLGLFDSKTAWSSLGEEVVERDQHVKLARLAAQKSIVLLKNDSNVLPLKRDIRKLYVAGPHAANSDVLLGNYNGFSSNMVTILDGIVGKVSAGTNMDYRYGQLPYQENINPMDWSTGRAASYDATIVVLGISSLLEGEEGAAVASPSKGDRVDLNLPEHQLNFLRKLRADNPKPLILVLTGGSPIATPEIEELADAILFVWYPGQQGGNAVADVIFGDVSPSGRLPITFPTSVDQLPPYEDYSMKGRTYKYMQEKPLYPFGYGLSYTTFEYGEPELTSISLKSGEAVDITVKVSNTGAVDATEVVQLYISSNDADFDVPNASLIGFKTVYIPSESTQQLTFTVKPEQMDVYDDEGKRRRVQGQYTLYVGGVSPGERSAELTGKPQKFIEFKLH